MRRTITGSLLLIIAVSYLLQITIAGYEDRFLLNRFYVENGEYYRLFTVALLHGGLWHLAFNLLALYALGTPLENYFGKSRYLLILFVSLICGSTLSAPDQRSARYRTHRCRQDKLRFPGAAVDATGRPGA